jgi:signal transduction histidine kinase
MNKMWSDLDVLEKTCSSGLRAEDLEAIRGSLSGLRALADELGEVANPASRRPEVIHVDELIEHCLSLLSAELAAKAVKVTKDIPAVPPIYADRRDAVRIVLNILGNGVEAVAANGAIRIGAARTDPRPDGSSVSITFENSGPGVPEGDVHRVFDPFFTTKRGGTGLGLFSARKRAQANGGDVACEFVCGGGSRFVATFPAAVG